MKIRRRYDSFVAASLLMTIVCLILSPRNSYWFYASIGLFLFTHLLTEIMARWACPKCDGSLQRNLLPSFIGTPACCPQCGITLFLQDNTPLINRRRINQSLKGVSKSSSLKAKHRNPEPRMIPIFLVVIFIVGAGLLYINFKARGSLFSLNRDIFLGLAIVIFSFWFTARFARICQNCGKRNFRAKHCDECGTNLDR